MDIIFDNKRMEKSNSKQFFFEKNYFDVINMDKHLLCRDVCACGPACPKWNHQRLQCIFFINLNNNIFC